MLTHTNLVDLPGSLKPRNPERHSTLSSYAIKTSNVEYNISVDISGCEYGVKRSTIAGKYTHLNGTIQIEATAGDILDDLKSIAVQAPDAQERQRRLANHTMTLAQFKERSSNELLDNFLICKGRGEVVHDELRHLLWSWPRVERFFLRHTVVLVSSVAAAALGGGVTMLGGVYNLTSPKMDQSDLADRKRCTNAGIEEDQIGRLFQEALDLVRKLEANGTDSREALDRALDLQQQQYEAEETRKVLCSQAATSTNATIDRYMADQVDYRSDIRKARNAAIITGTTVFAATLSAGIINDLAARRQMRLAEAFPANLYLAMMRRVEQLYEEALEREANEMAALRSALTTSSPIAGTSSSSSSSILASPTPSLGPEAPCLSVAGATGVTQILPDITSEDLARTGLTHRTFAELEQAIRREIEIHGSCQNLP